MPRSRDTDSSITDQRLDVWLWHARFLKSRSLATKVVVEGKVRVNRVKVTKASYAVKVGDVVTAVIHGRSRVIRVVDIGVRRGPPAEAALLYEDIADKAPSTADEGENLSQSDA